jgi:hypothetical protein
MALRGHVELSKSWTPLSGMWRFTFHCYLAKSAGEAADAVVEFGVGVGERAR